MSVAVTLFASCFGVILVGLGMVETFMAVLHPRAVAGPVTSAINRGSHRLLKTSWGQSPQVKLFSGPLLIVTQVLAWASLLLIGASLIFWPQLGRGITASGDNATDQALVTAIYYAGFTITTLGVGESDFAFSHWFLLTSSRSIRRSHVAINLPTRLSRPCPSRRAVNGGTARRGFEP